MLILANLVLLVAKLTHILASEGVFSLHTLLQLAPQVAFVALGPVLNLVLVPLIADPFRLPFLLPDLLAELQLNSHGLMGLFLLFLLSLHFLKNEGFEFFELFGLSEISYLSISVLFSRFLKISVC